METKNKTNLVTVVGGSLDYDIYMDISDDMLVCVDLTNIRDGVGVVSGCDSKDTTLLFKTVIECSMSYIANTLHVGEVSESLLTGILGGVNLELRTNEDLRQIRMESVDLPKTIEFVINKLLRQVYDVITGNPEIVFPVKWMSDGDNCILALGSCRREEY